MRATSNRKFFVYLFFLFFAPISALSALSKDATISVITMWPGKEIYIAFGHNAIRVRDPVKKIDYIYNYGSFDFDDPLFIPKFVYGDLHYYLSYYPFEPYMEYDTGEQNRRWVEQVLDLSQDQVNRVYAFLSNNAREENKFYRYDFIKDNCATRIPDALIKALGSGIRFAEKASESEGKSFRKLSNEYLDDRTFFRFLFFLVLGTASDKEVTPFESSFLPEYLMHYLDSASVEKNGEWVPLIASSAVLFDPTVPSVYGSPGANPAFVLWPLAFLVVAQKAWSMLRRKKTGLQPKSGPAARIFDFLIFFAVGGFGCLLVYLDFFSVHSATKGNLNLFWMWPTHFIAAFFLLRKKTSRVIAWYFAAVAAACVIPVLCFPFWPQEMEGTMIPLMLILAVRSAGYFMRGRNAIDTTGADVPVTELYM